MNTIECPTCGDGGFVAISARGGSAMSGSWTGTCATCGSSWDFED